MALIATALFVSACHPARGHVHYVGPETGFMKVNDRLECPEQSGDLTRSSASADGITCTYGGPNEETVVLELQPLVGAAPQAALARLETRLTADAGPGGLAPAAPPQPPAPPAPEAQTSPPSNIRTANSRDWDTGADNHADDDDKGDDDDNDASSKDGAHGHANIDLPGLHISANGDKADVQLPGLSIHANGDDARVQAGWWGHSATIEGHNGGATIRVGHAGPHGVDAMLILASDQPGPTGYRTVGYVAKGPPAGPLVIATFKSKGGRHSDHDLAGDGLRKLVDLNVQQGLGWLSDSNGAAEKDAKP